MIDHACSLCAWLLQLWLSDAALSMQLAYDASKSTVQLDSLDSVFFGGDFAKVNQVHSGSKAKLPKAIQNLQHNARTRERK